jgi:hypothetical protein
VFKYIRRKRSLADVSDHQSSSKRVKIWIDKLFCGPQIFLMQLFLLQLFLMQLFCAFFNRYIRRLFLANLNKIKS